MLNDDSTNAVPLDATRRTLLKALGGGAASLLLLQCSSSPRKTDDDAAMAMYREITGWIDDTVGENPGLPGFAAILAWVEKELPKDLTDRDHRLLFSALFVEGVVMARRRREQLPGHAAFQQGDVLSPPITFEETRKLLTSGVDTGALPAGFFVTRLEDARRQAMLAGDPATPDPVESRPPGLFARRRPPRCGFFCRIKDAVIIIAFVLVLAFICVNTVEQCKV